MTDETPEPQDGDEQGRKVREFAAVLEEMGGSHDELSTALQDLIDLVVSTGKKGSLTYTISVSKPKNGPDEVLAMTDAIGRKFPSPTKKDAFFFIDPASGNPVRDNPRQPQLPFRAEGPAKPTIREAR